MESKESSKRRRVLVVDDDADMRGSYRRFFEQLHAAEFAATIVADGEKALGVLRSQPADLVVLDWSLPGISGPSLAKALRAHARTRALGILMITAKSLPADTVFALEAGADDYLAKPFDWGVLLARLRSLIRRRDLALGRGAARALTGLDFDFASGQLRLDGRAIALTPKEAALLEVFLSRPNLLHAPSFLWNAVWSNEASGWDRTLITTLSSLRRKLGPRWGQRLKSLKGRGYIFET